MVKKYIVVFLLLIFPVFFFAQLETIVEGWKNDKELKGAITSFCVYDIKTQSVIASHNHQTFVMPASTQKALTTAAALSVLGSNFRFSTKIVYTGTFNKDNGLLNGDILIIGGGDPTLQSEYFYKKDTITDKWAKAIKEFGIKEIKGRIIGDASVWEKLVPNYWIWADISNYFGAVPLGLNFMDNKFKIIFKTTAAGNKSEITGTLPPGMFNRLTLTNKVIAGGTEDEAYVYGDPFGFDKVIAGKLPPNKINYEVEAALPDPALLCAEFLHGSLQKAGIKCEMAKCESNYTRVDSTSVKTTIYTHYSPSLDKIVQVTNLFSNNLYAESILRALGKGSWYLGADAVKKFLISKSIDVSEIYYNDGSGLSRANNVTTNLQAQLLAKLATEENLYKTFYSSLPIAGKSGSMRNVGKGTYIEDKMRAKTGYINRARGYCGYLETKTGRLISFSVLFNNYNCTPSQAKQKIEKFLIALADL